jgi:hypothetical protein
MLVVLSCGGDDDDSGHKCPALPEHALLRRVELEGNCGSVAPAVAVRASDVPGCLSKVDDSVPCFISGTITCGTDLLREYWLDGSSGIWTGEDVVVDNTVPCVSKYALTLDAR